MSSKNISHLEYKPFKICLKMSRSPGNSKFYSIFRKRNPILLGGGDNLVLHPEGITITSIWDKLHENVIRYVLEIYFPSFCSQNQKYQQVTWPTYDVIMEFAINSMVKLSQNQKCCNFVKNWYIWTKSYEEVLSKDFKLSEMNIQIFLKHFSIFPDFVIFIENREKSGYISKRS